MYLIDADFPRDALRHRGDITCQHYCLHNAVLLHLPDRVRSSGLDLIGDHNVAQVFPGSAGLYGAFPGRLSIFGICRFTSARYIDDRPDTSAGLACNAQHLHQFEVARCDLQRVNFGDHALAADFLHVRHTALVQCCTIRLICPSNARRNRMRGVALRQSCEFQHMGVVDIVLALVVDRCHFKVALRDRTGLVHNDIFDISQRLHEVGALDQNTLIARAADPAEERQRYTDHDRAGTADDQECERSVDPVGPQRPVGRPVKYQNTDHRTQDCQRQRAIAHSRRIPPCEFGDKLLGLGLALARVLHKFQDLGRCGLIEFLGCLDAQQAAHIHGSADDLIAGFNVSGQALAGQRAGIERGGSLHDNTVDRHLLAGPYHDDTADLDLVGIHFLHFAVLLEVGVIGPDIHQFTDTAPALSDRDALEKLADLIKEHDCDALRVFTQDHCADRCHCHQKALVKNLMIQDPLPRLAQDVISHCEIGYHKEQKPQNRVVFQGQQMQHHKHNCCRDDTQQQVFLFLVQIFSQFCHRSLSSRSLRHISLTGRSRSHPRRSCSCCEHSA